MKELIKYTNGELTDVESVTLFQELLDSGIIWKMDSDYQTEAKRLLSEGLIDHADRR
jgi:hypothetical protein